MENNVVFKNIGWFFFFCLEYSSRCLCQKELCRKDVGNGLVSMFENPSCLCYFASMESQRQRCFRTSHTVDESQPMAVPTSSSNSVYQIIAWPLERETKNNSEWISLHSPSLLLTSSCSAIFGLSKLFLLILSIFLFLLNQVCILLGSVLLGVTPFLPDPQIFVLE